MTFARLAKLLALVIVAFALWKARPPAAPAQVAILALPGASYEMLSAAALSNTPADESAKLPESGAHFWQELLSLESADEAASGERLPLWEGDAAATRALAVPGALFGSQDSTAASFTGSSAGAVVDAADITTGRLPAPYDRAIDAVSAAAATLNREKWSDWITVEPAPRGAAAPGATAKDASEAKSAAAAEFQFARIGDHSYYFSPAYVTTGSEVIGLPFLRGADRELRPVLAEHLFAVTRRRLEKLSSLFATGDRRPVVVFDTLAEELVSVFLPDTTPAAMMERVREALAADVAQLRSAVGPDGLVIVVGGPRTGRQALVRPWYRIFAGSSAQELIAEPVAELESARALVRYAAGISLDASEKSQLPAAVAASFPIRATVSRPAVARGPRAPQKDWSPASLESVPGAVVDAR